MDVVTFSWRNFSELKNGPNLWIPFTVDHKNWLIKEYNATIEHIPQSWKTETLEDVKVTMPRDRYMEFCLQWM